MDFPQFTTYSDDFRMYNISKDIYPFIALSYDPIYIQGYIYKEAVDMSNYEDTLFNCICGQVYPISAFMQVMRSERHQELCNILKRKGASREECKYCIDIILKQIIPIKEKAKVCGPFQRGAVTNIKTVFIVADRSMQESVK